MIGFPPHKFLSHQISSVAVSVMCRTCNLMVGVQYQSILNFFFFFNFFFLDFFSNFFKGLLKRKEKNTASKILLFKKKTLTKIKCST